MKGMLAYKACTIIQQGISVNDKLKYYFCVKMLALQVRGPYFDPHLNIQFIFLYQQWQAQVH